MMSTKDKILSAVVAHIKDGDNPKQISISMIASEAKIGKSTVYEHFSSKEDMVSETYFYLLKHYEDILLSDIQKMDFKSAFIEQLEKILFVMKDAKILMNSLMNFDQASFIEQGNKIENCAIDIRGKMKSRFESIIRVGVIEGIIIPKTPKPYLGNVIQAVISGLMFQFVNDVMDIKEETLYELIYDHVLFLIKKD